MGQVKLAIIRYLGYIHTFRNRKETNEDERVLMCSSNAIVDIPDREINRVILVLTGRNRDSRLVGAKNDRDEHRPMCCGVCCDYILRINC